MDVDVETGNSRDKWQRVTALQLNDDQACKSCGSRTSQKAKQNVGKVRRGKSYLNQSLTTHFANNGHPYHHPPCHPAHFSRCRGAQKGPKVSSHSPSLCLQSAQHRHIRQLPASSKPDNCPSRTHRRCQCAVLDPRVEGADKRFFPRRWSRECHRGENESE
jgi:hypothetical protein